MTNDNQTNLKENDTVVNEEDTEISLQPPAPDFVTSKPTPVQPVIPVAAVSGEPLGALPQQPQVVYVATPTTVEPRRSWGWIPAVLALLLVATVAGVFIGAELYKRSIYAESASPYSSEDVSPYANSTANENKSAKSGEENSLAGKKESENIKFADDKSESRQINSISNGFASVQKTEMRETGNDSARSGGNEGEENNEEGADEEVNATDEKKAENGKQKSESEDDDEPPPPPQRKSKEFQPKKVENVKDMQNIAPPQRNIPD